MQMDENSMRREVFVVCCYYWIGVFIVVVVSVFIFAHRRQRVKQFSRQLQMSAKLRFYAFIHFHSFVSQLFVFLSLFHLRIQLDTILSGISKRKNFRMHFLIIENKSFVLILFFELLSFYFNCRPQLRFYFAKQKQCATM